MGLPNRSLYLTPAMVFRKFWFCCLGFSAFFLGCSSDNKPQNFSYLRSPAYFKADTTKSNHDFCADFTGAFTSQAECVKAKKYRLSWLRPEDTAKFLGYRIYVDTTPPNMPDGKKWEYVRGRSELASIIVQTTTPSDSIIFVFGERAFQQDTLRKGTRKVFVIDTSNRQESESGRLVFALVPVYGGDVTPGQPQLSWFIINDKFPPDVFNPAIKPLAREVSIAWERPTDPTSFFNSSLDTGLIRNYRLQVTLGGRLSPDRKKGFSPKLRFFQGGREFTSSIRDSLVFEIKDSIPLGHVYFLPDSNRAHKSKLTLGDSLSAVLSGLTPRDTLNILLWAVDSAGNENQKAMQNVVVHLTDTTQPSMPKLSIDSSKIDGNRFIVKWTASSDSVGLDDGTQKAGPSPNFLIEEYHLRRTMIRDSGEKISQLDRMDTVIHLTSTMETLTVFLDTMRFLPPGRVFQLRLSALDVSGFESPVDTLTVSTPMVRFTGVDSALACPNGFVPIPRGQFALGETAAGSQVDESPLHIIKMGPYCIEAYEHRDTSGNFVANVSWDQADSLCRNIDTAFNTQLCSESEWERACEGPGIGQDSALFHGIQSEQKNPAILQTTCNQGTNDSVMSRSFDLRNGACLTKEGVYDMAGNYSEWVRDPYSERAYSTVPVSDSLSHGFTFADSAVVHGFRGGNFLKPPNLPLSSIQNMARCSNRDFAQQVRPIFRPDCRDTSGPKIAVIYSSGLTGHFCMDIPSTVHDGKITDLIPAPKDSTKLLVFLEGKTDPVTIPIEFPSENNSFKGKKPISVRMTTRSLAAVTLVRPGSDSLIRDTLDATEMRDTSQASLGKIFAREAGKSGWVVKQEGGKYSIRFLYAYAVTGTKPAKPYYSSRAISFRCCSLAKSPPPVPKVAAPR